MRLLPRLSLRYDAETLLLYILISFGTTVVLIRTYLKVTGYPTVGHGSFHIAHLLWGGLAMAVAGLVLLIFSTPRVHAISAILVGSGIGLFIDEVGKFITTNNDYFYRPAAPIIYICFLIVALIYFAVRRRQESEERKLIAALEQVQALIEAPAAAPVQAELRVWLDELKQSHDPAWAHLAVALADFVASQHTRVTFFSRVQARVLAWQRGVQAFFERHIRTITVAEFTIIILRVMFGMLVLISALVWRNPPNLIALAMPDSAIGVMLEAATAMLMLIGLMLYFSRRPQAGMFWLQTAMVLALTVVGVISFYQDQFVATLAMLVDLFVWKSLRSYSRRLQVAEAHGQPTAAAQP